MQRRRKEEGWAGGGNGLVALRVAARFLSCAGGGLCLPVSTAGPSFVSSD